MHLQLFVVATIKPEFCPPMEGFDQSRKLEKEDYYKSPEGYIVFTEVYHLKRGYCCQSGCKHCPYGFKKGNQQ